MPTPASSGPAAGRSNEQPAVRVCVQLLQRADELRKFQPIGRFQLLRPLQAEAADVESIEGKGGATLVDARPASFFLGKEKASASKAYGHIPGALNIDSAEFYDAKNNRLKPKAELAAIANAVQGPVVSYCNTGHWASTDWFVFHEVLGRKDAKLYAGSMVEWTSNDSRSIESSRTKWDDLKKALGLGS